MNRRPNRKRTNTASLGIGDEGPISYRTPKNRFGGKPTDIKCTYVVVKSLGNGSFGRVYSVRLYRDELKKNEIEGKFAIKVGTDIKTMKNEIALYDKLKQRSYSDHILYFYGWKKEDGIYYLLLEEFGQSLQDRVRFEGILSTIELKIVGNHILNGMAHFHNNNVILHDVKPGNVLVAGKGGKIRAKLCDFGSAYEKPEKKEPPQTNKKPKNEYPLPKTISHSTITRNGKTKITKNQQHGTWIYKAPELFPDNYVEYVDEYDSSCDMWCFGLIIYYCSSGYHPSWNYKDIEYSKLLGDTHLRPKYPRNVIVAPNVLKLIDQCLSINPDNRGTPESILNDQRGFFHTFEIYEQIKELQAIKHKLINDIKIFGKLLLRISNKCNEMHEEWKIFKDIYIEYASFKPQHR
eukprot:439539_1